MIIGSRLKESLPGDQRSCARANIVRVGRPDVLNDERVPWKLSDVSRARCGDRRCGEAKCRNRRSREEDEASAGILHDQMILFQSAPGTSGSKMSQE
jgi:hypothetical protein